MNTTSKMRDDSVTGVLTDAVHKLKAEVDVLRRERDDLAARLAKVEPVAWVPVHPRFGALWAMTTATPSEERLPSHYPLSPLYASSAPDALAQAREVLSDCATTLEGYARHHAERGPEHAHKVTRNAELAARCRAALAAKE